MHTTPRERRVFVATNSDKQYGTTSRARERRIRSSLTRTRLENSKDKAFYDERLKDWYKLQIYLSPAEKLRYETWKHCLSRYRDNADNEALSAAVRMDARRQFFAVITEEILGRESTK